MYIVLLSWLIMIVHDFTNTPVLNSFSLNKTGYFGVNESPNNQKIPQVPKEQSKNQLAGIAGAERRVLEIKQHLSHEKKKLLLSI